MGQLNIKSDKADALVSRLVALTGENKTQAVVAALEERLARVEREQRAEERVRRILDAAADIRRLMGEPMPTMAELDAELYDPDTGLPA
ncbi:type II toxin-antitoxin system VapB family antitoxin [Falsiroseomonas stagni]|uniref:Antitoxin VapB n=1 Tax=Falsiroseomonas stagni DSM 19981 TaxID=1123062 RepID=A0A1I4EM52_9PROT|nr:type II toxin-antitoxin system VapB family antitoxin [Falsiroseomonas stagni]SFL06805.1 hypothetical protein SAMN02745775_11741 [Falsiroseomonas stagni DSM 19981]